jgi:O-antigen/teichoic acid export membrane protein
MPELRAIVLLLAPAVFATGVVTALTSALMACHILRGQVLVRILDPLALLGFAAVCRVGLGAAPWVLALAHALAQVVIVLAALAAFGRRFALGRTVRWALAPGSDRTLMRFSVPMWAADGLAALESRADLLTLGRVLPDPVVIGMYALAKQMAGVVSVVRFAFDPVFWPRVATLAERGDRAALGAMYRLVARWVAVLALPLALVLAQLGPSLVRVFGHEYHGPLLVFVFLTAGQLANAVFGLAGHLMAMSGRPRLVAWGYALGVLATAFGVFALVPPLGVSGAALASALAYGAVMSYQVVRVWRVYGIVPVSLGLSKPVVAAVPMAALMSACVRVGHPVAAVAAGMVVYWVALGLLGPEPEDRALLGLAAGPQAGSAT